jgi:4-hydroxybenzoate polyprenyltransferase
MNGELSARIPAPDASVSAEGDFVLMDYVRIARPDHWIKNIFVIPGAAAAVAVASHEVPSLSLLGTSVVALLGVCLTASANYTINEYLDAEYDRYHPLKQKRPGARGVLDGRLVLLQYLFFALFGLLIAAGINTPYLVANISLLAMGLIYNVAPLRSKDRAYVDVLSESINNPIRFLLGWFIVAPAVLPPVSALLAYWMGGAFLMAVKRYSEYRRIGDPQRAALYRKSFKYYSENSLLLSAFFYAVCSAFFIGIFLIKYRVGLVLTFPLFAGLFTYYLSIGIRKDSAAQAPEKLYREVRLMTFAGLVFLAAAVLFMVDVPILQILTETQLVPIPG